MLKGVSIWENSSAAVTQSSPDAVTQLVSLAVTKELEMVVTSTVSGDGTGFVKPPKMVVAEKSCSLLSMH